MRILSIALLLLAIQIQAQIKFSSDKIYKITYQLSYNDQIDENQNPIWALADAENALITNRDQFNGSATYPFEMSWLEADGTYQQFAFLDAQQVVSIKENKPDYEFELLPETKKILGYTCHKAKTSVNSNTIEIWYTQDLGIKAGPSVLGSSLGLVLEYVRNGNLKIQATSVKKEKIKLPTFIGSVQPESMAKLDYQDKIWRSRFTTIPVFEDQSIHWSEEFEPKEGVLRFANGTIVVKKVKFPKLNTAHQVFVDLIEQSAGDAYDRTGSVFMIPMDQSTSFLDGLNQGASQLPIYENGNGKKYQGVVATENYSPLVELMRFFTPFGVNHFNDRVQLKGKEWQESVPYRQEISSYANLLSEQEVYLGVFIGNYDKGGHKISMNITIHNQEESSTPLSKAIPLFNTLNVMEMAGQEYATMFDVDEGLLVEFELKEDLKNAQLRYITTGHGGWGNGDEFVPKKNSIYLNGKLVFDLIPWREDCGSYRLFNPVSGNFSNGLSSSDLSRSNWCPGTVTNPYLIDLGDLKAGKHHIQVRIPQGAPEGSSFSSWNVSGVLVGE